MEFAKNNTELSSKDAYIAYELAYFDHSKIMGDMTRGSVDPEEAVQSAYELEESLFEAIEADCFDELTGLQLLHQEIWQSAETARYYGHGDVADKLKERMEVIEARTRVLATEQYGEEAAYAPYRISSL